MLMRLKDWVLLVGAITGLMAGAYQMYYKPQALEARMSIYEEQHKQFQEDHDKIIKQEQQYTEILRWLQNIDRKLDRR